MEALSGWAAVELTRGGLCSGWVEGGKGGPCNEARDPACVSRRVPAKLPDRVATVSTRLGLAAPHKAVAWQKWRGT